MDAWCVLLEEPSPGRVPDLRPVHYCESREQAVEQALKFAREFEPPCRSTAHKKPPRH